MLHSPVNKPHTHQFIRMFGPCQVTDLWACVHTLQGLACECVPEAHTAVCRATPTGQQAVLMWGPSDGLHCSQVLCVGLYRGCTSEVPYKQFVIIASRGKVLMVRGPLEATHLEINTKSQELRTCHSQSLLCISSNQGIYHAIRHLHKRLHRINSLLSCLK